MFRTPNPIFIPISLVALIAGACHPDPITEVDETRPEDPTFAATPTAAEDGSTPEPLDISGTWAYKTVMTQRVQNAFDHEVFDLQTVTSYYVLTHTRGDGPTDYTFEAKICRTDLSEVSRSIATISQGFYAATAAVPRRVTLSSAAVRGTYHLEELVEFRGVNLPSPEAPMPKAESDDTNCKKVESDYLASEGVYDYDGDGDPGFTIVVDGDVSADLWAIERLRTEMEGTIFSEDEIRGSIDGLLEDIFICSSKPALVKTDLEVHPVTGPESNFFLMVRQADGLSCTQLLNDKDTIFP